MGNCWPSPVQSSSPHTTKPCSPVHKYAEKLRKSQSNPNCEENRASPEAGGGGSAVVQDLPASGRIVTPNLKMFTYSELKSATRNFRPDTVVGEGGFGRVFKGWVDEKTYAPSKVGVGIAVAVKKSNPDSSQGLKEWQSEVKFLGKFSHPNLVKLIGYCWEDKQFLLVYEYMKKGSLESHLFRKAAEPLSWHTRLKIALGAAKGLSFLHTTEKKVIYRDFKSANILLDEDFNAKLSDFGLAKCGPADGDSHVSTGVVGTYGYAAPEYIATGHLYVRSDVYGFGVVLLEIITGLKVLDMERPSWQKNLVEWAKPSLNKGKVKKLIDPRLEDCPSKAAIQTAELILKCLEPDPKNRPSMEQVLESLQQINAIKMKPKESRANGKNNTTNRHQQNTPNSHHPSHGHNRSPLHHRKYGGNGGGAGSRPCSPLA
ncbi:Serine/threonine-protein kinase Cx32 precursor [Actinidia chinensis var. chinensis]|uniref:non-specific serine/threonine protein kinase n=1 Tax=Actinidia chinensis var. chinensis TaxID=1590841 RepID=A0A2R6PZG2_ACTCC|nr:Serine/threonine-protein kinase Cx32 precursor [Actinidia chinensis var. chinensis]